MRAAMTAWDELVRSAMLGTERQPLDETMLPEPVRAALPADAGLLAAAALLTGYRRAGVVALRGIANTDPPAPADPRPLVPALASARLGRMLLGDQAGLLPEWLAVVADRGLRVPPERLPALAEAARTRPALRPAVLAAAGPRGSWLADRSEDWALLLEPQDDQPEPDADSWRRGGVSRRRIWLTNLRGTDPAAARDLLAESWPTEPPANRQALLAALRTGLGPADEEFLEAALDDPDESVGRAAALLLARLPGSRLGQRMADRLAGLVTVTRRRLEVRLPAEYDAGLRRDGVQFDAPAGVGQRAWWLRQIVGTTPLSFWANLGTEPAELVRLKVTGQADAGTLHAGLAQAVAMWPERDWANALLATATIELTDQQLVVLINSLPADDRVRALAGPLIHGRLDKLADVLRELAKPWPAELGRVLLDQLDARAGQRGLVRIADVVARSVPPACFHHPITARLAAPGTSPWHQRVVETLLFRRAMYEELA